MLMGACESIVKFGFCLAAVSQRGRQHQILLLEGYELGVDRPLLQPLQSLFMSYWVSVKCLEGKCKRSPWLAPLLE